MTSFNTLRTRWKLWRHRRAWHSRQRAYEQRRDAATTNKQRQQIESEEAAEYIDLFEPKDDRLETEYMHRLANRFHVHLPAYPDPPKNNENWHFNDRLNRYVLTSDGCWLVRTRIHKVQELRRGRLLMLTALISALAALVSALVSLGLVQRLTHLT